MNVWCLSGAGPCEQVCDVCAQAHDKYVRDLEQKRVSEAILILTARGYKIIPPEAV